MDHLEQQSRLLVDGGLAVGGIASLWWLPLFDQAAQAIAIALGVVVGLGRLYMLVLEWRDRREARRRARFGDVI